MKYRDRLIRAHKRFISGEISTSEYCRINLDILDAIHQDRAQRDKRNADNLMKLAGVRK